jgi:hypothetical protein
VEALENDVEAGAKTAEWLGAEGRVRSGPNRGREKEDVARERALRASVEALADVLAVPVRTAWRWIESFIEPRR